MPSIILKNVILIIVDKQIRLSALNLTFCFVCRHPSCARRVIYRLKWVTRTPETRPRITFRDTRLDLMSIKTRFYLAQQKKTNRFLVRSLRIWQPGSAPKKWHVWHWESVDSYVLLLLAPAREKKAELCNYNSFSRFSCRGGFRCCCRFPNECYFLFRLSDPFVCC